MLLQLFVLNYTNKNYLEFQFQYTFTTIDIEFSKISFSVYIIKLSSPFKVVASPLSKI